MKKLDTKTRQKQIVEVSLDIIKQGGIQSLTRKAIAKQIGISEQAIYRHFDSKLDILTSIIHDFNKSLSNSFEKKEKSVSVMQQIKDLTGAHIEFLEKNPAVATVIFAEEIFQNESSLAREVNDALDKRINRITELIKHGQKGGEIKKGYPAEYLAYMFLGSLRLLVTTWRLSSFSFGLQEEGKLVVRNIIKLISKD